MMERVPEELKSMIVVQLSSAEDLAALRQVSSTFCRIVDGTLRKWAEHLPEGERFATNTETGLWILQKAADGMGVLGHSFCV